MPRSKKNTKKEQVDFDTSINRLKDIVKMLEDENISIEQGLTLFKEGCDIIKKLKKYLQEAKQTVEIYSADIIKELDIEEF